MQIVVKARPPLHPQRRSLCATSASTSSPILTSGSPANTLRRILSDGLSRSNFFRTKILLFKSFQQLMHILFWLTGLLFTRQFDPRRNLQICNRSGAAFYYWWDREPVSYAYSGSFLGKSLLLSKCLMQIHVLFFCRYVSRWVPVLLSMNRQCFMSYTDWLITHKQCWPIFVKVHIHFYIGLE